MSCIFCKIVSGEVPYHKVWEDSTHLAFLSIYPNTEGVTVVIPKQHYSSYVFGLPTSIFLNLLNASKEVARLLDTKLDDVGRTGMVCEGFGVDHAHVKLFPLHGTKIGTWQPVKSSINDYYNTYPGYISSHDSVRADDAQLAELALKIRK